jgi:RNA polymerase sigma-70 factor (ECF subfamily)
MQGGQVASRVGYPEHAEFTRATGPYRRELLAHCYRMLGSVDEAEDLVQETYLRAWRAYHTFEGRSSLRAWLYRIATNACLTERQRSLRRVLPSGLGAPSADPYAPPAEAGPDVAWLQPMPDALIAPDSDDPAAVVAGRTHLRLALIASLQLLPARQRAVLLLCEVLSFPAAEAAAMLDVSVAAVKSMLQRARARLRDAGLDADELAEPADPVARDLLERYIAAFERADVSLLRDALRADAALEVTGTVTWFSGRRTCLPYMGTPQVIGVPGEWRMLPATANGQPAAAAYRRGPDGVHRAFGLAVLAVTTTGITRITVFCEPGILARFGFPDTID